MSLKEIKQLINETHWFHKFEVLPGVTTDGSSDMLERVQYFPIPEDLRGKRVLDIGCADGFFTFLAEERGAEVVAVDAWPRPGFFAAHQIRQSKAEFYHISVEEISPEKLGMFDIVFFFGVYYHLKNPIQAIENIARLTTDYALIESAMLPDYTSKWGAISQFHEHDQYNNDATNWWVPNELALIQTIRSAGFPLVEFVCRYHNTRGIVRAVKGPLAAGKMLTEDIAIEIDTPVARAEINGPTQISGWAYSQRQSQEGFSDIIFYLDKLDDPTAIIGKAKFGEQRDDLIPHLTEGQGAVGFRYDWDPSDVPDGDHTLYILIEGTRGWNYRRVPVIVNQFDSYQSDQTETSQRDHLALLNQTLLHYEQTLQAQQVEITRLQSLVNGYEQGHVMRLMRWFNSLRKRLR